MIAIEGPDKSGKSTLTEALSVRYEVPTYHWGVPLPGSNHVNDAIEHMKTADLSTVYDRLGISGLTYDFLDKNNEERQMTTWNDVERLYRVFGQLHLGSRKRGCLVFVTADKETLQERFEEEGDSNDYVNIRELIAIKNYYDALRHLIGYAKPSCFENVDILTYNSTHQTLERFIETYDWKQYLQI